MSYSFPTKQGQGAQASIPTRWNLADYTFEVQFSSTAKYEDTLLTIPATSAGNVINFTLTPEQVKTVGSAYYRVKGTRTSTGRFGYFADGATYYKPTPPGEIDVATQEELDATAAGKVNKSEILDQNGKVLESALPARLSDTTLKVVLGSADPVLSDFVYDPATNNLLSYKEDGIPVVLTYNADGTVATQKRGTGPTRAFSYTSGNLSGVA